MAPCPPANPLRPRPLFLPAGAAYAVAFSPVVSIMADVAALASATSFVSSTGCSSMGSSGSSSTSPLGPKSSTSRSFARYYSCSSGDQVSMNLKECASESNTADVMRSKFSEIIVLSLESFAWVSSLWRNCSLAKCKKFLKTILNTAPYLATGKAFSKFCCAKRATSADGSKNEQTQRGNIFFKCGPSLRLPLRIKAAKA